MQYPPTARRWLVTAGWSGRTVMRSECDGLSQAIALVAVLAAFWPGLTVFCRALTAAGTAAKAAA